MLPSSIDQYELCKKQQQHQPSSSPLCTQYIAPPSTHSSHETTMGIWAPNNQSHTHSSIRKRSTFCPIFSSTPYCNRCLLCHRSRQRTLPARKLRTPNGPTSRRSWASTRRRRRSRGSKRAGPWSLLIPSIGRRTSRRLGCRW